MAWINPTYESADPMTPSHSSSVRLPMTVGVLAFAFVAVSCGEETRFPPRYFDLNEAGLVQRAEIILIGRTTEVQWGTTPIRAKWTGQPFIETARLIKLRVVVEGVIRGTVKTGELTVYTWGADVFTNAHSLNRPNVGERAIHYLVNEQNAVRYVTDVIRSDTIISSGAHRSAMILGAGGTEIKIARILLTPGEDFHSEEFIAGLGTAVQRSLELVGFMGTLPLLKALLDNPDAKIRAGACEEMYQQPFFGQDVCADKLGSVATMRNPKLDELRVGRIKATSSFKSAFLTDPMRTAKDYSVLAGTAGIADFLRLIAMHPDKQLATRAQNELEACCKNESAGAVRR